MAVTLRFIKGIAVAGIWPMAIVGRAAADRGPTIALGEINRDTAELLASFPPEPGRNITALLLRKGATSSQHLIHVRGAEEPHLHREHDLAVILLRGQGTLRVAGKSFPMRAGDIATIAAGQVHYFSNEGEKPAAVLAHFSPAFDGTDTIPVTGGKLEETTS